MIKELILITIGNPYLLETWSGVPYFLTKELRNRDIIVNVIDLEPNRYIKILYNVIILPLTSLFVKNGELSIYRSIFFRIYQKITFKRKLKKYNNADAIIGLSYNLMIPSNGKPIVLLSDWPFSYTLEKKGITPGFYQRTHIKWDINCLKNATHIISIFPTCSQYINKIIEENKAISLGVNVINNKSAEPDERIIENKSKHKRIVFIGRLHYLEGLLILLQSYKELKEIHPELCIDIIGMNKSDIEGQNIELHEGVNFWGYLDKGNNEECEKYYNILNNASLYVNTTPGWVGYTSMIEAMYFYTPVIVYPCKEFIDEFGVNINFGRYCDNRKDLANIITNIYVDNNEFRKLCINAHNRVSEYTWENYVNRLLNTIEYI